MRTQQTARKSTGGIAPRIIGPKITGGKPPRRMLPPKNEWNGLTIVRDTTEVKRKRSTTDDCNEKKKMRIDEEKFIEHCWGNDQAGVKDCLSRGVDVNTVSEDGRWSGLTIAAEKNYPELLEILLSHHHMKINKTTQVTIKFKDTTKVESLWTGQWTGLMFASYYGNSAIVSRLIKVTGLDINYQDEEGDTAAHLACMLGRTECVRILAETGRVDWNRRDKRGGTALYMALYKGHSDIVDIIVQQPNIDYNVKTQFDETLGHAAVEGGNVKCVETLAALESFDSWNFPESNGDTPIMSAIKENKENIFKILSKCNRVDLKQKDEEGADLITIARNSGKTDILLQLHLEGRDRELSELRDMRERHVNFLITSMEEKKSELECPVCLETAGGEIFSCVEQHLVCSQCRPRVVECPQCRQLYPPTPIRHRYAEKIAAELEKFQQELKNL